VARATEGKRGATRGWRGFFVFDAPALGYLVVVFYLGAVPGLPLPRSSVVSTDKIAHFFSFGLLVPLLLRLLSHEAPRLRRSTALGLAALFGSLLGALLEIYQMAFPYRSVELDDWLADTLGAGAALLVLVGLLRRKSGVARWLGYPERP